MPQTEISPLYINPDDTRETIEALIRKSDAEKLLLIFAGHTSSSIGIIDLQLLHRMALHSEKQLAIATRNAKLRDAADHLGLPHFRTPSHARRLEWLPVLKTPIEEGRISVDGHKQPQRYQPIRHDRQWWEWAVMGILLLLTVTIGLLFLSRATITIEPIPQTQSLPLEVTASTNVRAANLTGEIPLRTSSTILEATTSGSSSGILNFPEGYAEGILTVTNLTGEELNIPAGLTVQTVDIHPVQFITNEAISLSPAGEEDDSTKVEITAKIPGRDGNVTSGEILAVVGEYGSSVAVTNPGSLFGGYNRFVNTPSDRDIDSLRETLLETLLVQAKSNYSDQMEEDDFVLLPETIQIEEILSEEVVPMKGEPADEFHLTLRIRFTAQYLDPADLEQLSVQLLNANLEEGFTADEGESKITPVMEPVLNEDGSYQWSVLLHRQVIPDLSELNLEAFTGQPRHKLRDWFIENYPYLENVTITSHPGIWWRLPVFPKRMEVIVL